MSDVFKNVNKKDKKNLATTALMSLFSEENNTN